ARYFQRQHVTSERVPSGWRIRTAWSQNGAYYVDPRLSAGLSDWSTYMPVGGIPLAVRQDRGFMLALNDCWSLLSWSCKLALWQKQGRLPSRINVVHLDSHTDLNSPRLTYSDGAWLDLLTGKPCDVLDPRSVASAIQSGAIGIGSFIAPLIAGNIPVDLFHLAPTRHLRHAPDSYGMRLELRKGDPLFASAERPHIRIDHNSSPSRYLTTDDVNQMLPEIDPRYPTFLHIDMDYFNNRFDGRPDWEAVRDRHDPALDDTLKNIDRFFEHWIGKGISVSDVSVGISPGFFPAEYWKESIEQTRAWIQRMETDDEPS
ncbi:MAG TPA: hypothetical protein VNH22_02275, partial [Blastocatellia bacterium]|nr:hypothetical protein [Blastocatellia bacterium]